MNCNGLATYVAHLAIAIATNDLLAEEQHYSVTYAGKIMLATHVATIRSC